MPPIPSPRRPACESCHQAPGTRETHCPAMLGLPAAIFLLCDPCAQFSDELHGLAPVALRPWPVG